MTYREAFSDDLAAIRYDQVEYADTSYAAVLWPVERRQIDKVLSRQANPREFTYLDFACGTGRVLSHISKVASSSIGVEISPTMAAVAKLRAPMARILTRDITDSSVRVEGVYDVITAFRFILNAEPELRLDSLKALRLRLADSSSILIFNNHGNLMSHKALLALRTRRGRLHGQTSGHVMSHKQVVALANAAGLAVCRVSGCGLLGGRVARVLPRPIVERIETWFGGSPLWYFGSNQIYVAQLPS